MAEETPLPDDYCLYCGAGVSIPYPVPGDEPFCNETCMKAYNDEEQAQLEEQEGETE